MSRRRRRAKRVKLLSALRLIPGRRTILAACGIAIVLAVGLTFLRGGAGPVAPPASALIPQPPPATPRDDAIAAVLRQDETRVAAAAVAAVPAARAVPAWQRNAAPAPRIDGRAAIAIIIDDMGVDRRRSRQVVALNGPLTLAYLPYAPDVGQQAANARRAGHEVMLHMPMEPEGREDPGPQPLTVSLGAEESRRRLGAQLDRLGSIVGANNHMGSRFTANRAAMQAVAAELAARGLFFVDSRTTAATVAEEVARAGSVPAVARDVFLDNEVQAAAVRARLQETEGIARRRGSAIAIGHPHDATVAALAAWMATLRERGFVLVPVSAIVRMRTAVAG